MGAGRTIGGFVGGAGGGLLGSYFGGPVGGAAGGTGGSLGGAALGGYLEDELGDNSGPQARTAHPDPLDRDNDLNTAYQYGGFGGSSTNSNGANQATRRFQGLGAAAAGARGPQADYSAYNNGRDTLNGFATQENQNLGQLSAAANGHGPSAAVHQLGSGLDQSLQQQAAIAAGARGGGSNIAAAQRNAASQGAALSSQANQSAGLARANEQLGAMQQYTQALTGRRAQQLQAMGMDADNANKQASLDTQFQMQGRQLQTEYERMGMGVQEAQMRAQQALMDMREKHWEFQTKVDRESKAATTANFMKFAGMGGSALSSVGSLAMAGGGGGGGGGGAGATGDAYGANMDAFVAGGGTV